MLQSSCCTGIICKEHEYITIKMNLIKSASVISNHFYKRIPVSHFYIFVTALQNDPEFTESKYSDHVPVTLGCKLHKHEICSDKIK